MAKNNTIDLIPYERAEGNLIKVKDGTYLTMIKIKGNNFFDFDWDKQAYTLDQIWELYKEMKYGFSILKLNEFVNRKDYVSFLEEKKHFWEGLRKNNMINEKQYFARQKLIDSDLDKYNSDEEAVQFKGQIYLCFYGKTEKEVNELEKRIISKFESMNLLPVKMTIHEKVNAINKLIDLDIEDDSTSTIEKYLNKLDDYFSPNEFKIKSGKITVDNGYMMQIANIDNYPFEPKYGFLLSLVDLPCNAIVKVKPVNVSGFEDVLAKGIKHAALSLETTKNKEVFKKRRRKQDIEKLETFADTIGNNEDVLYSMNTYLIIKSTDRHQMKKTKKIIKEILQEYKITSFVDLFRQFDAFNGILPKIYDPLEKVYGREIPLYTIVHGMPFISSGLNDKDGWFIGQSKLGEEIYFNQNIRDYDRKNSNKFVCVTSGGGKSTYAQIDMAQALKSGEIVFLIDPEGEYSKFANYIGENVVTAGSEQSVINPMQIQPTLSDIVDEFDDDSEDFWGYKNINAQKDNISNYEKNKSMVEDHKSIISIFYKTFYKDINDKEDRILLQIFGNFYNNWMSKNKLTNIDITEWENKDFPVMQDFYEYMLIGYEELQKNGSDNETLTMIKKIIDLTTDGFVVKKFSNDVIVEGRYVKYFNKHTKIDINDGYLTVFDISALRDKRDDRLFTFQMLLIIILIERQLKINNYKKPGVWQRVIIDEAHILIDKDNPISLDFVFRMVKMIRKRNGGITIITQNPEDFVSDPEIEKKTKAIVNNSNTAVFLNMNESNVKSIMKMYTDSDGFTESEIRDLKNARTGSGMLMIGKRKFMMDFVVSKDLFEVIRGEENKLREYASDKSVVRIFNNLNQAKNIDISNIDLSSLDSNEVEKEVNKLIWFDGPILFIKMYDINKINIQSLRTILGVADSDYNNGILNIEFSKAHTKTCEELFKKIRDRTVALLLKKRGDIIEEN